MTPGLLNFDTKLGFCRRVNGPWASFSAFRFLLRRRFEPSRCDSRIGLVIRVSKGDDRAAGPRDSGGTASASEDVMESTVSPVESRGGVSGGVERGEEVSGDKDVGDHEPSSSASCASARVSSRAIA